MRTLKYSYSHWVTKSKSKILKQIENIKNKVKYQDLFTVCKVSKYGDFSGPYFSAFSPNTGKYRPKKPFVFGHFSCSYYRKFKLLNKVDKTSNLQYFRNCCLFKVQTAQTEKIDMVSSVKKSRKNFMFCYNISWKDIFWNNS